MDRKKLLLIFGIAWVSAALLTWLVYSMTKAPKQDKLATVIAAARDLPAGTRLKKTDVRPVRLSDQNVPRGAAVTDAAVLERVLLFPVAANEPITLPKLASLSGTEGVAATIEQGKRAVSVQVNDTSGVAGLITPRAHVDVLFTRPGSMQEAVTTTVLQDVVVLAVGRVTEVQSAAPAPGSSSSTPPPAASSTQARAVTLLVTPEQAEKLELAKNQGKVSLALRNPLDRAVINDPAPTTSANLYSPDAMKLRRPGASPFVPGPGGRNLWAQLTGDRNPDERPKVPEKKEPPKPKNVVDVYRGDKHVQEIFP
jgi:pilus assembly protein CpaB